MSKSKEIIALDPSSLSAITGGTHRTGGGGDPLLNDVSSLASQIKDLTAKKYADNQNYQFTKATYDSQKYEYEEAAALLKPLVHSYPSAAIERFRIDLALNHR